MLYGLLAVLVPSLIATKLLDYLNKGLSLKNTIYYYFILLGLSSCFDAVLSKILFGVESSLFNSIDDKPILFSKFMIMSIIINVFIVLIIMYFQKNLSIDIVYKKVNEKKKKRR